MTFAEYNLCGLIVAYLESKGWEFYDGGAETEDVWLFPDVIQFEGYDATVRAISWQIKHEEATAETR